MVCDATCVTCNNTATGCLSCDGVNHHRVLSVNTCVCGTGFYETAVNSPTVCLACSATCLTCSLTSANCTSCDTVVSHRQLNVSASTCDCVNGYFDTIVNGSNTCLICSSTCLTCTTSASICLSCDTINQHRSLNSNTCMCNTGFYETSVNTPSICLACNSNCLTCSIAATNCTSCQTASHFTLNTTTNTCVCQTGFYLSANSSVCLPCTQLGCLACVLDLSSLS